MWTSCPLESAAFGSVCNSPCSLMALSNVWRQVLGQEDVWRHFTTVLENMLVVCNIVHVGSWEQLQAFLINFAARQPGMPMCWHLVT